MSARCEALWDGLADTFDDDADHGLRDPVVRAAWDALLMPLLPPHARVADLGCGTGSLSVLLAGGGHRVSGVDLSGRMAELAQAKAAAAGVDAVFTQGDAAEPPLGAAGFDVVLARHVLWVFEDPDAVLARWLRLLRPGGTLILIEGRWSTGAGLTGAECAELVLRHRTGAELRRLSGDRTLWGTEVTDERYLLISRS
jgi:ubiquinone/menaquinone biosynthesis C-methylase UbiE